jgi:hypothetical protein
MIAALIVFFRYFFHCFAFYLLGLPHSPALRWLISLLAAGMSIAVHRNSPRGQMPR